MECRHEYPHQLGKMRYERIGRWLYEVFDFWCTRCHWSKTDGQLALDQDADKPRPQWKEEG